MDKTKISMNYIHKLDIFTQYILFECLSFIIYLNRKDCIFYSIMKIKVKNDKEKWKGRKIEKYGRMKG